MSEFESFYPPKPKLVNTSKKSHWHNMVMSLLLISGFFILFFADSWILFSMMVGVLVVHELGHFLFMKIFSYKDARMFLFPFFSKYVKGKKVKISQVKRMVVLLAGPLPGIFIGAALFYYAQSTQSQLLMWMAIFFLTLNIFNLLPIDPLDGGKMLETMIYENHGGFKVLFSFLSSLIFIAIGYLFSSWVIVIFGFLLGFRVRMLQKIKSIHSELDDKSINYRKTYKYLTDADYWQIRDSFIGHTPGLKDVVPGYREVWENEQLIASQINQLLLAPIKNDLRMTSRLFLILIWLIMIFAPFIMFLYSDLTWFYNGF